MIILKQHDDTRGTLPWYFINILFIILLSDKTFFSSVCVCVCVCTCLCYRNKRVCVCVSPVWSALLTAVCLGVSAL